MNARRLLALPAVAAATAGILASSCTVLPDCSVGSIDPSGQGNLFWTVEIEPPEGTYHLYVNDVYHSAADGPVEEFGSIYFVGPDNNPEPLLFEISTEIDGPRTTCGFIEPPIT